MVRSIGTINQDCYPATISYADVLLTLNREPRGDVETFATGYTLGRRNYRLVQLIYVSGLTQLG